MEKKQYETYLLEDFLSDESFINYCLNNNAEDKHFWKGWLLQHPEKLNLAEEAGETFHMLSLTLSESEYQQQFERISLATEATPFAVQPTPSVVRFLSWKDKTGTNKTAGRRSLLYIAAAVFVLCLAGYFLFRQAAPVAQLTEKYNNGKTPLIFTLSDSTVVTLAPNSSLRYPPVFGEKERTVYLDGDAGFHVSHNAAHPFKVYEGDLVATVLGTIFDIKKQQKNSSMIVELLQGKVQVDAINQSGTSLQSIILKPNERVVYQRNGNRFYKEAMKAEGATAGQEDIAFQQDNFEEVAIKMKAVFGVTLINTSNKKNWHFTGRFNNITVKEVMENICVIEKVNYQVNGDTILIK